MGKKSRDKGYRIERELVQRHIAAGIPAERVPLSGGAGGSYTGDIIIGEKLRAEVKARANGEGFATLEKWLGDNDLLILRRDRSEPMVLMQWETYAAIISAWLAVGRTP